jgi:type IV pilus assembly protein PilQ
MKDKLNQGAKRPGHDGEWRIVMMWLFVALAILIDVVPGVALAGNALKKVDFSALPGNKVQIRIALAEPTQAPKAFATDSPARLVLDFQNTSVALPNKKIMIGVGAVHSLTALDAGGRARVVLNLDQRTPYELKTHENEVIITFDSGMGQITQETRPEADTALATQAAPGLKAVDFRRGESGEGRVLVTLDKPDVAVDVKEEGKNIVLDIPNTSLPAALRQRLDVVDFATPVHSIVSEARGSDVRISIQAVGEYEYLAYQVDRLYTLEFRPISPEEQEKAKQKKQVYTGEPLSLNFQDIPVRTVLHLLGDFTSTNMVISDTVRGNVTLRLKNVPWDQALDIVLKTKSLDKREKNNVIYVAPAAELITQEQNTLAAEQKVEELAPLHSEVIQLNYADADDIASVLKSAGSTTTATTVDTTQRGITANTQKERESKQSQSGSESLLSERGHITVHKQTNSLLIQDTAQKLEEVRALVAKLDIPVRQVLIESRIVVANNDFSKSLGVRFGWSGSREIADGNAVNIAGGQPGYQAGTDTVNKGPWLADVSGSRFNSGISAAGGEALLVNLPAAGSTGSINFLVGKIGSYLLQLELSAMQSEGRGEIVSSPRVVAGNREKAKIEQGYEIPYQESAGNGTTTTTFKKAVLSLDVTPRITADSRVSMQMKVNNDDLYDCGSTQGPCVKTQSVETTVLVDNGDTVVLGGVHVRRKTDSRNSVPFFGDVPVLGNLFKNTSKIDNNSELLIFVTPKILKETLHPR